MDADEGEGGVRSRSLRTRSLGFRSIRSRAPVPGVDVQMSFPVLPLYSARSVSVSKVLISLHPLNPSTRSTGLAQILRTACEFPSFQFTHSLPRPILTLTSLAPFRLTGTGSILNVEQSLCQAFTFSASVPYNLLNCFANAIWKSFQAFFWSGAPFSHPMPRQRRRSSEAEDCVVGSNVNEG